MEGSKFDDLARAMSGGVSRRGMLKRFAVGLAATGGILGQRATNASARDVQVCHGGQTVTVSQQELNLRLRQGDMLRVECCADGDCANQYGACGSGSCQSGYCVQLPVAAGTSCDDGSFCNGDAHCDGAFNCVGGSPIVCPETDNPCTTSVCSDSAQGCQDVPLDDGAECGTNDACVSNTCMSGACISRHLTDCTGTCADCSGECVDLHADLDNCGTCGHACEDLGKCLTTTCVPPGICLNTPVNCPGGDQCNTAACDPDTGCYLQPKTGASCTTEGSNNGTCGQDGACHPICPAATTCSSDGDCGAGKRCLNGACFTLVPFDLCSTECAFCDGGATFPGSGEYVCADLDFGIGVCSSNADCPSGSFCNSSLIGGPYVCTRPCPQPQAPV